VIEMPRCCRDHAPRAPERAAIELNRDAHRSDEPVVGHSRRCDGLSDFLTNDSRPREIDLIQK
jgi:hypothetical protein